MSGHVNGHSKDAGSLCVRVCLQGYCTALYCCMCNRVAFSGGSSRRVTCFNLLPLAKMLQVQPSQGRNSQGWIRDASGQAYASMYHSKLCRDMSMSVCQLRMTYHTPAGYMAIACINFGKQNR